MGSLSKRFVWDGIHIRTYEYTYHPSIVHICHGIYEEEEEEEKPEESEEYMYIHSNTYTYRNQLYTYRMYEYVCMYPW
jgi:hypothetical protein